MKRKPKIINLQFTIVGVALALLFAIPDIIPLNLQFMIQAIVCVIAFIISYRLYMKKYFLGSILSLIAACVYEPFVWIYLKDSSPYWLDMISAVTFFFIALGM